MHADVDDPEDIGWAGGGRCSERFIDTTSKADTCRRKDSVNNTDKAEKVNHQLESIFSGSNVNANHNADEATD